jgi:flagellar hook-basal body complex protein FliE
MVIGPIGGVAPIPNLPRPTGASAPGSPGGLAGISGPAGPGGTDQAPAPGFGDALGRTLQQVSDLEHHADALVQDVATGGPTKVHEVMVATTEAALAVDLVVQVRDRALEAYHEIMRLQL